MPAKMRLSSRNLCWTQMPEQAPLNLPTIRTYSQSDIYRTLHRFEKKPVSTLLPSGIFNLRSTFTRKRNYRCCVQRIRSGWRDHLPRRSDNGHIRAGSRLDRCKSRISLGVNGVNAVELASYGGALAAEIGAAHAATRKRKQDPNPHRLSTSSSA